MFIFFAFHESGSSFEDLSPCKISLSMLADEVLHPFQMFERQPFWNGWRYEIF
jgi:hypothetical protein